MGDAVVTLTVVVSLAVSAPAQPRLREQLVLDLAVLLELDLALENVDFAREIDRHPTGKTFFPASQCAAILDEAKVGNDSQASSGLNARTRLLPHIHMRCR